MRFRYARRNFGQTRNVLVVFLSFIVKLLPISVLTILLFSIFTFDYKKPLAEATLFETKDETSNTQYAQSEKVFLLDTKGVIRSNNNATGQGEININDSTIEAKVLKYNIPEDIKPSISTVSGPLGTYQIKIDNPEFKPGKYQLEINLITPEKSQTLNQDFTWGVLAINTNKSIYLPGEEAYLQMAALKDDGHTICDGNLELLVTNPQKEIQTFLTRNATIESSTKCLETAVTNEPDYSAKYTVGAVGVYEVRLKNLANGYEITDSFEVKDNIAFDIQRTGPTRIYPPADYQMAFKITANQDFQGEVSDYIPSSFELKTAGLITDKSDPALAKITWQVNWTKGETYEFNYAFNAPDISPEFYLLGRLKIGDPSTDSGQVFQEARKWQIAADAVRTSTETGGTWATGSTWVGGVAPLTSDDAVIATTGSNTVNIGTSTTIVNLTINSGATLTHTSNKTLGVTGNYVNNGIHTNGTGAFSLTGTSKTIDGTGTEGGSGAFTVTTGAKSILSTAHLALSNGFTITGAITVTNNGYMDITGAIAGSVAGSTWVNAANSTLIAAGAVLSTGTLTASANPNTINYDGAAQTVKATATYYNLTLSGSGAKTLTVTTTVISGNLTLSGTATTATVVALTVGGNISVGTGTTLTLAGFNFGVTGTTDVTGTLTNSSATGTKTLTGNVTLNSGAVWNESATAVINFGGDLTNNATTWTGNTGIHTFTGSGKSISGSTTITIPNITIGAGASVTNSGTVICSTALASGGAGSTWINGDGSSGTLNFAGSSIGVSTFTASAAGNLVNYNGAAQTVFATATYHDLNLSTSGAKTWGANPTAIDGDLTLSGTATTAPSAASVTIGGSLSIGTGTTLTAPATLTITGNYSNSGIFTAGSGTIIFNATTTASQNITCGGTDANHDFNNLTVTNNATAGVTFSDSCTVSGTFADNTNDSKIIFTTTATYAFTNIDIDGTSDHNVILTSTNASPGTPSGPQWFFNVSQVSPTVSYVTVYDSDANGGNEIDDSNGGTDGGNNEHWKFISNLAPNSPSDLIQKKVTGGTTLATGDWTNETQVQFNATASDTDNPDTLYLCVEKDPIGTGFSSTNGGDLCGSGVAYSGTPVTISVTITGLTDATAYHWQAQVKDTAGDYSSFVVYGGNLDPNDRDFGVDTTAPTGGSVYDGTSGDQDWNDGSLTELSANWTGFNANASGLQRYEYAVRRSSDGDYWNSAWQAGENWYDNSTNTSVTVSSMVLNTSENYYFSVKCYDLAGNIESAVSSNGQRVLPTLSFTLSGNSIIFENLNNGNSWTDTKNATVTTSTNAVSGYAVKAYTTQLLTSLADTGVTISNFSGTWLSPVIWLTGNYGFGYTSSDSLIFGSDRFGGGTKYAGFSQTAPGDIVADHTDAVNGSTGAVANEQFTITYKLSVSGNQTSSVYQTTAIFMVTANY